MNSRMQFVVAVDGSNPVDSSTGGKSDPQSTRNLVNKSYGADVGARRGGIGGTGSASGGDAGAGARVSPPWGVREPRWPRGGLCDAGHGRREVGKRVCKGKGRVGLLAPEDEDDRARGSAAALRGVQQMNARSNSGGSGIELQGIERGESRSGSDEEQRAPTSSPLRHLGEGKDGIAAGRRKRDRQECARTDRSLFESRGGGSGGSESGTGTRSTSIIRKIPLAGAAVSTDGDVSAEGAASAPWSVRWATGAPLQREGHCDGSGASGADSSPNSGRRRPRARRRIGGGSGVNGEEAKSNAKGEYQGERSG